MTDATGTHQVPESSVAVADSRTASPSKARRRLILAAGAVLPSIYTLSSGAQTAVASNMMCLLKQPPPPQRFTSKPDNWVRAPVAVGEYDGTPADCVTSPQSACGGPVKLGWREVDNSPKEEPGTIKARDGSVWIIQGNRVISSPNVPITNVSPGPRHYGLVYVDQAGTVSTLDPDGALHLSPLTTSCWASTMVNRGFKLG